MIEHNKRWILQWFLPVLIILTLFYLFPLLDAIRLSFTNARIGLANVKFSLSSYEAVLTDPDLPVVLRNTVIFVIFTVFCQLTLGLLVGLLLETHLKGMGLLKLAMITAWVVPGVIAGITWNLLYSSASWGVINNTLELFGAEKISFMTNPSWALVATIIANVWRGTGFSGIMQYGALRGIDPQLYEAASIDGAGSFRRFWGITLPMLKPMLMINLVLITISTVNTYDAIWALTKGGPGISTTVLSLQTYKSTFLRLNLGQGAVYAVLMILSSTIFTAIYLRMMKEENRG
ncbi:MAG: sugar ABC transporter permease [Spirochaetales bacterium]|nr:sugar ABC transporter permease [Spirochaetales bacterium]